MTASTDKTRRRLALVTCLGAFTLTSAQAASYHLIDLGNVYPVGINHQDDVAGTRIGAERPMRFANGRWHALPQDGVAHAFGIDNRGDIVGAMDLAGRDDQPAIWQRGATGWVYLALPADATGGVATAITQGGSIAGSVSTGHCVTWDAAGMPTDLGAPPHRTSCRVAGMNTRGELAVNGGKRHEDSRGYLWHEGHFELLPTVGGRSSIAFTIDRSGRVAGTATDPFEVSHAVTWKSGQVTDLGQPDASWAGLAATALDDQGNAVGEGWSTNDGIQRAVLFTQGQAIVLDQQVDDIADWTLSHATGISNDGTIVGWGVRGNATNHPHGFMLVPMESASYRHQE